MSGMLQTRLNTVMQRELQAQNLQLSPYCTQQIEQMVNYGMQRLRFNNANENAAHVLQAERNLKFLVRYFSDYSRNVGSFPKLSNSDFDDALNSCPTFWPYCSSG